MEYLTTVTDRIGPATGPEAGAKVVEGVSGSMIWFKGLESMKLTPQQAWEYAETHIVPVCSTCTSLGQCYVSPDEPLTGHPNITLGSPGDKGESNYPIVRSKFNNSQICSNCPLQAKFGST
ncbi:hypothetical protein GF362_00035 [Candidatus Dojkabacteria bacterium]|nr:hypothetical protein [Candidatus Dojkabacteria bacterium]